MASFCENLRVKVFQKGHVLMEDNAKIDDIIWIRSGSLRVDK